jgi:hypothetical protein
MCRSGRIADRGILFPTPCLLCGANFNDFSVEYAPDECEEMNVKGGEGTAMIAKSLC